MVTLLSSNLMRLTKDKLKEGFIMDLDNLQLNFRHIKDIFLKGGTEEDKNSLPRVLPFQENSSRINFRIKWLHSFPKGT